MVKYILMDLDNTILDFNKAEQIALTYTLRSMGIEPTEVIMARYHEINIRQWELLELGELDREQVKYRRFLYLFEELGCPEKAQDAALLYENRLGLGHHFMDGAEELLDTLYEKYQLYLVTNGTTSVQKGRIESSGIAKYFAGIYISEIIGYNKPDPRYFDACFAQMKDFSKEEVVLIGDSLTSDIRGGINIGVKTIWMNPSGKENKTDIQPDYEITHLSELPALLKEISI